MSQGIPQMIEIATEKRWKEISKISTRKKPEMVGFDIVHDLLYLL